MSDVTVHVEFDVGALIHRYRSRAVAAQKVLDESVMKDTDRFVRFRTGALARSVQTASFVGQGRIVYDTPYAKRGYYDTRSRVTRDIHPDATPLWLEASKRRNLDSWREIVARILAQGRRG